MYINKIDELIDKIIDDFYNKIVVNKEFNKILSESNFVKYQLDINKLLISYIKTIDEKQIYDIVGNQHSVNTVIEIIKRYIAYYIFMTISIFYKGKLDTFINNVIEFSKNQPGFGLKIENFFNSENNSNIIKFYSFINNIITLLDVDTNKLEQLSKKSEYKDSIIFLNELGEEFVNANFKIDNLNGNKKDQAHNIIKTVILSELYFKYEKKDVYLILESAEQEKGVYTFIDIVIPRTEFIDFNSIEKSLSQKDVEKGLAYDIYDLILQFENLAKSKDLSIDEKILTLLNKKIVVPIVDDFLLYHKDSEKYEKQQDIKKKKDETKIRYIVNKIDKVTEYYSDEAKKNKDVKTNIENLFYVPLANRNAVLVNSIEDIKIINKLINQGKKTIENNEYYNDLITYMNYPYVNFKDFKDYGFNINLTDTIDAVRYVTLDKQLNDSTGSNKYMQLRKGSNGQSINIVGFMIPTKKSLLYCIKAGDLINVRNITYVQKNKKIKYDNAYVGMLKLLKHSLFKNKTNKPSTYWLFDLNKDKVRLDTYEQVGKLTDQEHSKIITASLYDDLLQLMYDKIIKIINTSGSITINRFYNILDEFGKKIFDIPKTIDLYNKLEQIALFDKVYKTVKKYDKNEDKFPGLIGEVIKLPEYKPQTVKKVHTIVLKEKKIEEEIEQETSAEEYGAICQHFLTWEKISAIRKKNPNDFTKLLFEFVMQYVIENYENDFICKSCGTQVDIKNYVLDGTYDDDGRFVTLSVAMTVPLEDIPEYEKYKTTIRSMDKLVDRISTISNIQFLLERSVRQKNPIKTRIIRDSLDMILLHNNNMREIYKDRSEKILTKYGISKELTNFFVFELDNNIFIFSSKDKDYYKPIKRNNILMYLLFNVILELNESHLIYLIGDKTCNYYLFSKFGLQLFDNLKIIKNNKNLSVPIQNYKVLCYILFYFSCLITKFNIWQYESEDKTTKKFSPVIQKIIIHTLVDLINSILEINNKTDEKHYLYTMIATKFFQKLNGMFSSTEIIQKIKEIEDRRLATDTDKKRLKVVKVKSIPLAETYQPADYLEESYWTKCNISKYYAQPFSILFDQYYIINNITNCETGTFHKWTSKGKILECKICHKILNELNYDHALTGKILTNYRHIILKKVAQKYCAKGEFHNFVYNNRLKCNACSKCKFTNVNELTDKDLNELENNVVQLQRYNDKKENILTIKRQNKEINKQEQYNKFITDLKNMYGKTKTHREDYYNFINDLITLIDSVIGKNININNENIYTNNNIYIIDHDHNGYPLTIPLIIKEDENKVLYKKDHPFFKTDVLYYTNQKLKIDVFYDAVTLLLLGNKEVNKDYELSKRKNIYMKINYSIADRLKLLGHISRYSAIQEKIDDIKINYKIDNSQKIIKMVVSDISRNRIQNLKQCIIYIQRYVNRIKYNYQENNIDINEKDVSDIFLEKYKNKLKNIVTKKDSEKFFQMWKAVKNNMFFQTLENRTINLNIDVEYVLSDDINYYDYHGNVILYYIVNEFIKLIQMNDEKFVKINLAFLIIDIIINLHKLFNTEVQITNYELKRFNYIINSKQSVYEMDEGYSMQGEVDGFYGEYTDPADVDNLEDIELREEAQEELDALDIEGELDYEIDYQAGINTE